MSEAKQARLLAALSAARRRGDYLTVATCERKLIEAGVRL